MLKTTKVNPFQDFIQDTVEFMNHHNKMQFAEFLPSLSTSTMAEFCNRLKVLYNDVNVICLTKSVADGILASFTEETFSSLDAFFEAVVDRSKWECTILRLQDPMDLTGRAVEIVLIVLHKKDNQNKVDYFLDKMEKKLQRLIQK